MTSVGIYGDENMAAEQMLISARNLEQSLLWQVIANDRMPYFDEPLTPAEKDLVRQWILQGALP